MTFLYQKGDPIILNFWNYLTQRKIEAIYRLHGYGVYGFTTCCYVRGNIFKMRWLADIFESRLIKARKFPFHCYQALIHLIFSWFYMNFLKGQNNTQAYGEIIGRVRPIRNPPKDAVLYQSCVRMELISSYFGSMGILFVSDVFPDRFAVSINTFMPSRPHWLKPYRSWCGWLRRSRRHLTAWNT